MIKLQISGYLDPGRSIQLTLPATEEQIRQAFDSLTDGVPIGKTFPYHITAVECACHQVTERIKHNSELAEVNLLAYILANIQDNLKDTALVIAGHKSKQDDMEGFINELAAVKNGCYNIEYNEPLGTHLVHNFDTKLNVYSRHCLNDWLKVERAYYEQRQSQTGDTPEMTME